MTRSSLTTALVATMLGAACADSAVTNREYADLARMVGAGLATPDGGGEVGALTDATTLARGGLPAGFTQIASVVQGSHLGMTYRYIAICMAASGVVLDRCGPSTDHAVVLASWSGMLQLPELGGRMRRDGIWHLTAVGSPMAMVTGTSWLSRQDGSFVDQPTVTYRLTDSKDAMMFVDMASGEMVGGGMKIDLVVDRSEVADHGTQHWSYDVAVDASFAPDQTVALTLDASHDFVVDLATGMLIAPPLY